MNTLTPPENRTPLWRTLTEDAADGQFRLQVCDNCGAVQYPPREICRSCLSNSLTWKPQDGNGRVLALTRIHVSLNDWFGENAPWNVASVQLDAGPTVVCHAPTSIQVGDLVTLENRLDSSGQSSLYATTPKEDV